MKNTPLNKIANLFETISDLERQIEVERILLS